MPIEKQDSCFASALFRGRNAFVAGGTSGINLAIAQALASAGAKVAVLGRDVQKANGAAANITASGGTAIALSADVRDYEALATAVSASAEKLGPLDFVIAGAAGNFVAPVEKLTPNGFKAVVDIDLLGTFHTFKAALPHLRLPGASLIAISSGQAFRPVWGQAHASAGKAGVESLVRTLALEWGPLGIRVNSLCPGPVAATEGVNRLIPPDQARQLTSRLPLRRFGDRMEIAQAALFLLSPAASYVTGTTLNCDGGLSITAFDGQAIS